MSRVLTWIVGLIFGVVVIATLGILAVIFSPKLRHELDEQNHLYL